MKLTNRVAKISLGTNISLFIVCIALFVFAVIQRMEATQERIMAEECREMVLIERNRADSIAVMMERQRKIAEEQASHARLQAELARQKAIEATQKP